MIASSIKIEPNRRTFSLLLGLSRFPVGRGIAGMPSMAAWVRERTQSDVAWVCTVLSTSKGDRIQRPNDLWRERREGHALAESFGSQHDLDAVGKMKQRQRRKQYDRSSSNGQKMAVAKSRLSAEPIDAGDQATLVASSGQNVDLSAPGRMPELAFAGLILAAAFVWAYWPTLVQLVDAWNREPDYSHGFFVAPLAIYFLWVEARPLSRGCRGPVVAGAGTDRVCVCVRGSSAPTTISRPSTAGRSCFGSAAWCGCLPGGG